VSLGGGCRAAARSRDKPNVLNDNATVHSASVVELRSMRLETHEGVVADPATREDVVRAVAVLTLSGEAYVILSVAPDDETYVQAAGTVCEDFIVERRDGCAGEHYRGDRRVTADALVGMLSGYLRGATDWSHAVTWHRIRVDFGAAKALA
jgi:hypothetical protein